MAPAALLQHLLMPRIDLTEILDGRLDAYRSLKRSNATRWERTFIAEGEKLVDRMLETGWPLQSVLAAESYASRFEHRLPADVPLYVIPAAAVDELIGFDFHRGVLACGYRPTPPDLAHWLAPASVQTLVICPDIKDPENLGSLIRISAAFGVDGMILGPQCADPFSRRVLRVSMGTIFRLPVLTVPDVPVLLDELTRAGIESWATVLNENAELLGARPRPPRCALLFGGEGYGLTPEVIERCSRQVTIAMAPGIDSLNVAIAAGIFIYQMQRQSG